MPKGCWIANVSDGSTHTEKWIDGELSPWRRLMAYCQSRKCYVTNLRMTLDKKTVGCPPNALGYWQTNAMPSMQGRPSDEELHEWHGIGWVDGEIVNIIWAAMDPNTHQGIFWRDTRPAEGQAQIIWGPGFVTEAPAKISVPTAGVRSYLDKIIEE